MCHPLYIFNFILYTNVPHSAQARPAAKRGRKRLPRDENGKIIREPGHKKKRRKKDESDESE